VTEIILGERLPFGQSGDLVEGPGRGQAVLGYQGLGYMVFLALRGPADREVIADIQLNDQTVFQDPDDRPRIPAGDVGPVVVDLIATNRSFQGQLGDVLRMNLDQVGTSAQPGLDFTGDVWYTRN
jgi:hypothetical protein